MARKIKLMAELDPYMVLRYPLSTEKSIRLIEFENKISFAINPQATKFDVKRAMEELFKVKVINVNVQHSVQGEKRAYIKLAPGYNASDISADLGLI